MTITLARRRIITTVICSLLLTSLAACGKPDTDIKRLRRWASATDKLAFRFTYSVDNAGEYTFNNEGPVQGRRSALEVRGVIEDDFRYKAGVLVQKRPTFERVVDDDAIAVRFLEPTAIGTYVDRAILTQVDTDTDIEGVSVPDALRSGRWVLDPEGAPAQTVTGSADRTKNLDPVTDALSIFDYVLQALNDSDGVQKWSADSLNPAYRTSEDPFPKPESGSGVTRYDLRRPKLPAPGLTGGGSDGQPTTKHFRKMAIYVKNERIIQVREAIELTGKAVGDFENWNRTFLRNVEVPEAEIKAFDDELKGMPEKERGALLLGIYATNVGQFGGDPITPRTMSFDLADLGEPNRVDLPVTDVVKGSLAVLVGIGRKPAGAAAGGTGAGDTGAGDTGAGDTGAGDTGAGDTTTTTALSEDDATTSTTAAP